jgi:hypothetical protein
LLGIAKRGCDPWYPGSAASAAEAFVWIVNVISVFLITRYLFGMNSFVLFYGWDAQALLSFRDIQRNFSDAYFGLGSDPINGLGNISFPINWRWSLASVLGADGKHNDGTVTFAIAATELFIATALFGRVNRYSTLLSVSAGWLITLATWPLYGFPEIVAIWSLMPFNVEPLVLSTFAAVAALQFGGTQRWQLQTLFALIFILSMTIFILGWPSGIILAVPGIAIFVLSTLLFASSNKQRLVVVATWAVIGILALVLGPVHYLTGLLGYTAAALFPDLSSRVHTIYNGEVSMLLWTPISSWTVRSFFSPERTFIGGGIIGSLLMIVLGSEQQRQIGLSIAALEAGLIGIGIANYLFNFWIGPAIGYFELYLLPFLALGFCYLLLAPFSWLLLLTRRLLMAPQQQFTAFAGTVCAVALPLLIAIHTATVGDEIRSKSQNIEPNIEPIGLRTPVPPPTNITRVLKSEITLTPGETFRGRVAVMIGRILPRGKGWLDITRVNYLAQLATGNLHGGPDLWRDQIPTLMEYSPLITPAYFVMSRVFLTEPDDVITRSAIAPRRVDIRMLKMLGVRFVITDRPVGGATQRAAITIPTPAAARARLGLTDLNIDSFELYLYELEGVNLGQFTPTEVKVARDAGDALALLSDAGTDFNRTVVAHEMVGREFAKAAMQTFEVETGHYHVRASSEGTAILLLPIEYSRCLRVSNLSSAPAPKLFRANLLLTGVVFERSLDANIRFITGPFSNSHCRMDDLNDSRRMAIQDAFRDRPEFGVLGSREPPRSPDLRAQ